MKSTRGWAYDVLALFHLRLVTLRVEARIWRLLLHLMDLAARSNVLACLATINRWKLPLRPVSSIYSTILDTNVNVPESNRLDYNLFVIQIQFWQIWTDWTPWSGSVEIR